MPNETITESALFRIVRMVFETSLGLPVKQVSHPTGLNPGGERVVGCIQISGAWKGAVVLDATRKLSMKCAGRLFKSPEESIDQEMIEGALGELANMVGGSFKALLPEPCTLSLPAVTDGTTESVHLPGDRTLHRLAVDQEGELLLVTVQERSGDLP